MAAKHRLQIIREDVGLTRKELAELAEVATQTIGHIENGSSPYKTHVTVANRLAGALYVKVSDIFYSTELSTYGRPAGTGTPISTMTLTYTRTETFIVQVTGGHVQCPHCHMMVPPREACIDCERPLSS